MTQTGDSHAREDDAPDEVVDELEFAVTDVDFDGPVDPNLVLVGGGARKYMLGPMLAKGGMGIVYEARDWNCQRDVAMKILSPELADSQPDLLRFIHEGQITSQLEHPNIVPIHEMGIDDDGRVFYTMKLVKGRTLAEILIGIRKGNKKLIEEFPLNRLLTIFQKVCDAVAFANSKSVVHRDLKPQNIMIAEYGDVQVMDWGLATLRAPIANIQSLLEADAEAIGTMEDSGSDPDPTLAGSETSELRTQSGQLLGSPGFIAPELITAAEVIDERADIYSLGSILYSMLMLRPPLKWKTIEEALLKIISGDIIPPTSANADAGKLQDDASDRVPLPHCPGSMIPDRLSEITMKALALNREERYQSVVDLQHDVQSYQEGNLWHTILDENFTTPGFLSRWEVVGGRHEIDYDGLRLFDGEPQLLILKTDVPSNVRIEFECKQDKAYLNDISCFISAERLENRKDIPPSGYEFKFGAFDNSVNALMRTNQQFWRAAATPLERDETYHICVERIEARLRMTVNGEEIINVVDSDPLVGADRVVVGLYGWLASTVYKHIRISAQGTPWRSDILDVAQRQAYKGHFDVAITLYRDVIDSFPDPERLKRAEEGLQVVRRRKKVMAKIPKWQSKLEEAWPGSRVILRLVNDGLTVDINCMGVDDLAPLKGMPVTALQCAHNHITSLEPLRGMQLATLNCGGNPITDLSPLRGMPLETVIIECCSISDLEPLRGMPVTFLHVGGNLIEDIEPLRGMNLWVLDCWSNKIKSLDPIRGMPLNMLNCASNRIPDLEALREMELGMLHCGGNEISTLGPLEGMRLSVLHCGENHISTLDPLKEMDLLILGCSGNQISTLEPLLGANFGGVSCGANPLTTLEPLVVDPPEDFSFNCDSIPTPELERIRQEWTMRPALAHLVRSVDVIMALRAGNTKKLKQLATEFNGHRYLVIPRPMRWEDAKLFCEQLEGHLVTITSEEENEFISSLFPGGCWFWMGLLTTEQGHEWVTGETFRYSNFVDVLHDKRQGPKVYSRKWLSDHVTDARNNFMIEWE